MDYITSLRLLPPDVAYVRLVAGTAGCARRGIRQYMGHSSITVTQKYMHLAPQDVVAHVRAAFAKVGDRGA